MVRSIGSPVALRTGQDVGDFEQELVDQYALAMAAAGLSDRHVAQTRSTVIEFARSLSESLRSATCHDADRFLTEQRRLGRAVSLFGLTVQAANRYALTLAHPDLEQPGQRVPRTHDLT